MATAEQMLQKLKKISDFITQQGKVRTRDTKLAREMVDAVKENNKQLRSFGTRMTSNNELLKQNNKLLLRLLEVFKLLRKQVWIYIKQVTFMVKIYTHGN